MNLDFIKKKCFSVGYLLLLLALFLPKDLTPQAFAEAAPTPSVNLPQAVDAGANLAQVETTLGSKSLLVRSLEESSVIFLVLLTLMSLSVMTWAISIAKWLYLRKVEKQCNLFMKSFWESRSLNDLNLRLGEFPYSPLREMFRNGYAELVRGSQVREQASAHPELVVASAMDNLNRILIKSKAGEKRQLERFLAVLATVASSSPFIGLFGTVWGIMNAFESIARTGSSSLAAVAPGISEALITTAFGLAAAIPALIGYNMAAYKIRLLSSAIEGFTMDFLNIVERYLVVDRTKTPTATPEPVQTPRI